MNEIFMLFIVAVTSVINKKLKGVLALGPPKSSPVAIYIVVIFHPVYGFKFYGSATNRKIKSHVTTR